MLVIGVAVCVHIIVRLKRKLHTLPIVSTVKLHASLAKTRALASLIQYMSSTPELFVGHRASKGYRPPHGKNLYTRQVSHLARTWRTHRNSFQAGSVAIHEIQ